MAHLKTIRFMWVKCIKPLCKCNENKKVKMKRKYAYQIWNSQICNYLHAFREPIGLPILQLMTVRLWSYHHFIGSYIKLEEATRFGTIVQEFLHDVTYIECMAFLTFMSVSILNYDIRILSAHKTGTLAFVCISSSLKGRKMRTDNTDIK